MSKALVIFSGGQDSTTCLGWAENRFDQVIAVSFKYGQKHEVELEQAEKIVKRLGIEHHIIDISFFGDLVDSALTHNEGDVNQQHERVKELPASFVPNRNGLFITLAHSLAQKIGVETLVTGVCQVDYSGYPDCRQEFIDSIEETLNLGSQAEIEIATPLMNLTKAEAFKLAQEEDVLDLVLELSHTCYNGVAKMNEWGRGCDDCPACQLRKQGYYEFKEGAF
ncbi:MAG: 7-cyano-7-deazaguanine synthase QueC [Bacillota bacterium]